MLERCCGKINPNLSLNEQCNELRAFINYFKIVSHVQSSHTMDNQFALRFPIWQLFTKQFLMRSLLDNDDDANK